MVAGIVYLALGLKKVLEYVADTESHIERRPERRAAGRALRRRGGVPACAHRVPLAQPALGECPAAGLGMLAAVLTGLVAFEALRYAEARHEVRHAATH